MKLKNAVKSNRAPFRGALASKGTMPCFQLITENVFLPVTKTIFTTSHCNTNHSKNRVKHVKSSRSNDKIIGPLLKRPTNCPQMDPQMKNFADTLLQIEQSDGKWNNRANKKKSKDSYRGTEENSKSHAKDGIERLRRQTTNQKERQRTELPFPCPISALPAAASYPTRLLSSMDDSTVELSNATKRNNKDSEETRKSKPREKIGPKKRKNVAAIPSLDWASLKSSTIWEHWNIPIASSIITTTTASTSNEIATGYSLMRYSDSASMKISEIEKRALSSSVVVPMIESPRTAELSTSANFLEKHNRTAALSEQNVAGFSGDMADRSAFKFLPDDPTRCHKKTRFLESGHPCEIKYSWQVIGRASQTSRTLLENLIEAGNLGESSQPCRVKYSWQIIGISTQTCERDFAVGERRSIAPLLVTKSPRNRRDQRTNDRAQPSTILRNGKRFIILNNQCTQTIAHKANQSNFAEMHAI